VSTRLDVGFVPAECPGAVGTGAVRTSTLLIERLSQYHDLTVYVSTQMDSATADLPAEARVEYVIHDNLPKLPHPLTNKIKTLRKESDALNRHDMVHSYSSAFIPVLADLDVPTLSTLNSYLPICPKADMMYHGERKCSGPGRLKCAECVPTTSVKRRQGIDNELRGGYVALGQIPFVHESIDRSWDIDAYHALSPHLVEDFGAVGFPDDRIEVIPHFYDTDFSDIESNPIQANGGTADDDGERERADDDGERERADDDGKRERAEDDGKRERADDDGKRESMGDSGEDETTLLYVGALQDIKGVHVLVRGFSEIIQRGHDATLRIAGTGPYGESLHDLAKNLGVNEHIEWLGYVDHDELDAVYNTADVFVYPGLLDEPFGRVLLEALSTRTPILASDVGSTDYIVGPAGQRFVSGDRQSLADAFERLVENYTHHYNAIPDHIEQFAPTTVEQAFSERYHEVAAMAE
jgi:glycosyltransferase involved in cell wall biosynthesis